MNLFENCKTKQSTITSLKKIYQDIKNEKYKDKINTLRGLTSEEEQKTFKSSQLPAFTYSAEFNGPRRTNKVSKYKQIIGLDYDNVDNPQSLKNLADGIPTTMMSFISPRGNGLKVFVKVNSALEHHKTAWLQVNKFYEQKIGQSSDPGVKDVTRLCFVSSDPEAYVNWNAEVFEVKLEGNVVAKIPTFFSNSLSDFSPGNQHNTVVSVSGKAINNGIDKEDVIDFFRSHTSSSYTINELVSTVEDCYNRYGLDQFSSNTTSKSSVSQFRYDWFDPKNPKKIVFSKLKRDLADRIIAIPEIERVFAKDDTGAPVFGKKAINFSYVDFYFMLHDNGAKLSDSNFNKLMNSDDIEKLNPLSLFVSELKSSPWDKTKRVDRMISAMNLSGDMDYNRRMLWKFFCNTYAFAMRGIDEMMPKKVYSRVVLILYTKQRNTGKSSFLRKLGMQGIMEEITGIQDMEIYHETLENAGKDTYDLLNALESRFIVNFDDIQDMIINSGGWLRSLISNESFGHRTKYDKRTKNNIRRAGFVGSTNHRELINDSDENRFLILTLNGRMDYEVINDIDMMQFWAEIRHQVIEDGLDCLYNENDLDEIGAMGNDYIYVSRNDQVVNDLLIYNENPKCRMTYTMVENIFKMNSVYFKGNDLTHTLRKLAPKGEDIYRDSNGKRYLKVDIRVEKIGVAGGYTVPNSIAESYLGGQAL